MSMKGISKNSLARRALRLDRVLQRRQGRDLQRYTSAILQQKMSEVCSTTLPQMSIPRVMTHPEYPKYLIRDPPL